MNSKSGFTLFEVLIYIGILSIVIYFIGGFAFNIYKGKDRIEALQDINSNGRFMTDTVSKYVEQSTQMIVNRANP